MNVICLRRLFRACPLWTVGAFLLILGFALPVQAADWPRPQGPVADYAKVIPADYQARIDSLARELWQKTGTALVVATLPSLQGETIENAAVKLFQEWGIGQKGQDKGVLVLVALKERRLRIEVGYGLEGVITDAKAGLVRDQAMTPFLKKNQFGQGLLAGAGALAEIVAAQAGVKLTGLPRTQGRENSRGLGGGWLILVLVLLFFFNRFLRRGAAGRRGSSGAGGLLTGLFLGSMLGGSPGRRGGSGHDGFGGGGFGGFGGGFGGFGGGMSGGGGASGGF